MKSINKIVNKFTEQFKNIPGILHIQEVPREGFIVVFVDEKDLKTCIPSEFEGVHVSFYNVRDIHKASKHIINNLRKMKIDLSIPKNRRGFESLTKTYEICSRLLSL